MSNFGVWGQNKPLFTLLTPEETRIEFNNKIVDTKKDNILIYSNFYGGGGVGVGDFNRDGLMDLYFAGNQVGDKLYLNKGNCEFKDITEKAGILNRGGWSSGVVVADVNRDGWEDIYVTKELYDNDALLRRNELYINQRNGTFKEQAALYGIHHTGRTRHATFFDYDKDGWLDLYLLNQPPNTGNYSELYDVDKKQDIFASKLFKNTGKGRFYDVTKEAGVFTVGFPNSVSASDLNNDGWTDLYVANDFAAPDWFFLNNGDGTFTNVIDETHRHISYYSMGVDAADINNDGWLDVMVLDMQAEDNFRIKSNMSGMNPKAFWSVVNEGGHYQYMFNTLFLNQGAPYQQSGPTQFSDIAQLAGVSNTDWSWSNLIADFDNDGWKDIFVTNGLLRDIRNTDADKNFSAYVQRIANEFVEKNPNAGTVTIWDILDLDEALKMIPSVPLTNYAYKNNGDLTFSKVIDTWGFDAKTFSNGSAYADLDNDGDLDLIINNINATASIYRNELHQRTNPHYIRIKPTDKKGNRANFGVKVRIETDSLSQWYECTNVRGMYSTSEPIAHFGLKNSQRIKRVEVTWWDGKQTILRDVAPNQVLEIDYKSAKSNAEPQIATSPLFQDITQKSGTHFVHRENDFDDYDKQVLLPHKMSQYGPALVEGDINGDGLEDFFIGGAKGQAGALFIQQENGFSRQEDAALKADAMYEDVDAALFDYDGDGDADLYVVSGGNAFPAQSQAYIDRLYENDGKGNFTRKEASIPALFESGSVVRPYDFDQDGDLDLFVGGRHVPWDYPSPATSRLLENHQGKFKDVTKKWAAELIEIGMVTDAQWADVDKNGMADLIIVGEWMPITVLGQVEERRFQNISKNMGLDQTEGWWYHIQADDIDGDGDNDFLVGNLGLNYKYKTSVDEPFEVFYDDFDDNDAKDIVLSYYNFGKKYPLRGRSCSSEQVPMLKKKFPTYNLFAGSELESVYDPVQLDRSLNYQAKTFASVWIEQVSENDWQLHPLPNEAQVSSINTSVIADFDQDGKKDILVAGNLYVSEIETPRNDAGVGLVLRRNEDAGFSAISPEKSGLMLPYDVKKIVHISTQQNRHYVVVACNDDRVRVLTY